MFYSRIIKRLDEKVNKLRVEKKSQSEIVLGIDAKYNSYIEALKTEHKNNCAIKKEIEQKQDEINEIVWSAKTSQPWLSKAFSDYQYIRDKQIAKFLTGKSHPALSASAQVLAIAKEKKKLTEQLKQAEYLIAYYEGLFPDLTQYVEDTVDDVCEVEIASEEYCADEVLLYVKKEEYSKLTPSQRNQLALDRYVQHKHSKAHIGKIYERYIGHLYESRGYDVEFFGIKKGLEDLGRDLICRKDDHTTEIVQCKNWSCRKEIHENAICQLYGTTIKFKLDNKTQSSSLFRENVIPVFVTTTKLSDTALEFAKALGVDCLTVAMNFDYPMIKCNISENGKIYHLPFDQQYDTTIIAKDGECYLKTIREAEAAGFRRAKRWQGRNS